MLKLDSSQLANISKQLYATRMREYLNSVFAESVEVADSELEAAILALTDRASLYNITAESDLAAYITCAWLMGKDFDDKFDAARNLLDDTALSGLEKAEGLWLFIEQSFAVLAEDEPELLKLEQE